MPRKSSIKRLPKNVRDHLHKLIDGGETLDEMVAALEEAHGAAPSRSAIGRYTARFRQTAAKMKEAKELAASWASQLGDIPDDRTGQLLTEMLHTLIFRFLLKAGESENDITMLPKEFMALARTLRDIASATTVNADREMKIRQETVKKVADGIDASLKKKGLTRETINSIRADILGLEV